MTDVNMPKLSDTMEEGTIVEWKKKSGDAVKTGDLLAEVESDKATFDLAAEADGVLTVLVEQGVPAKIGAPIARIGEAGEATPSKQEPAPKPKEAPAREAPKEKQAKAEKPTPREESDDGQQNGAPTSAEVKASPLAKRLAAEMGVDLGTLKGSGPEGRIVKEDVLAAAPSKPTSARPRPQPSRAAGPEEIVEPNRMQATIARRMAEAKSTIPEFQVTVEARVDLAVSMRQQLKDSVPGAEKVTMTDFLVRACALALRKFPEINTSWIDGRFQR